MPRALRTKKTEEPEAAENTSLVSKHSAHVKNSYTPILVILLIIASYLLGVLTTKIQYLEKGGTAATPPPAAQAGQQAAAPPAAPQGKVKVDIGHLPPLGNKDAKIKFIEFSDFQCPFCKQYVDQAAQQIKQNYIDTGKAVLYYRHFPLSFHPAAQPAAEASECANDQDKFWEYHDEVFKNQDKISDGNADNTKNALKQFAQTIGLDMNEFNSCFDSGKHKDAVAKDQSDGTAAGVSGTPSFYVNGTQLVGAQPYSAFQAAFDAELK